jgi:hypothetical protein
MTDSTFRLKRVREINRSKQSEVVTGTLDSVHQTIVSSIHDSASKQDSLLDEINTIEEHIQKIENQQSKIDIIELAKLHDRIVSLKQELKKENPLHSYFLKNADIMLQYYSDIHRSQTLTTTPTDSNTFLKYLNKNVPIVENTGPTKRQMFEEYISRMKLSTGQENADTPGGSEVEHCSKCNIAREEVASEGVLVCPLCGSEEYMMVVSDFPSFRDPMKERNTYAYKKINHLNEILNQFQAKESTIIPEEVMNEVICEVRKRRIQNIAELTEKDIREILKKLNKSKYYEHAAHILSRLNGNPPPTITPEIEEKIRAMFQEIQAPFLIHCPNDRTNFLSYSYILYKFFELLELDEYKIYFPLLKSRDRLIAHDQIWKKICDYLKWEFIQSV